MGYLRIHIPDEGLYLYLPDAEEPTVGPLSKKQVAEYFRSGVVDRSTHLWFEGLTNWIAVGDIPDFDRRKPQAIPSETPAASGDDLYMLYRQGEVVEEPIETLRNWIEAKELRRTDVIYERDTNQWVRADQHPQVKDFFGTPKIPVLPKAKGAKVPPIKVVSSQSAAAPSPVARRFAFRFVHGVALVTMGVLGYLLFNLSLTWSDQSHAPQTLVTYSDVQRSISHTADGEPLTWDDLAMPQNVRLFFTHNNLKEVLVRWASQFPKRERQDFIHNLGIVITGARGAEPKKTFKAIQEYRALKMARYAQLPLIRKNSKLEKAVAGLMVLLIVGLIALYGLVLVLLAGERRPRNSTDAVHRPVGRRAA